jgi:hypothetical protein
MNEGDDIRLEVLQLERRVITLTEATIRGHTDFVERFDRLAERVEKMSEANKREFEALGSELDETRTTVLAAIADLAARLPKAP